MFPIKLMYFLEKYPSFSDYDSAQDSMKLAFDVAQQLNKSDLFQIDENYPWQFQEKNNYALQ